MQCPECSKTMDILVDEPLGAEYYCHLCGITVKRPYSDFKNNFSNSEGEVYEEID